MFHVAENRRSFKPPPPNPPQSWAVIIWAFNVSKTISTTLGWGLGAGRRGRVGG